MEKNILIIDDDEAFLYIINRLIKKAHPRFNVTVIDDSESGVRYFCEENFLIDLVFLDINMPAMDGLEFLEKINALEKEECYSINKLHSTNSFINIIDNENENSINGI